MTNNLVPMCMWINSEHCEQEREVWPTHCFRVAGRKPTISMASCRRSKSCFRSSPSTVKQSCWFQEATSHRPLNSSPLCEVSPKVQLCIAPSFHYTLLHSNSSMHNVWNMYAALVSSRVSHTSTQSVSIQMFLTNVHQVSIQYSYQNII